MTEEFDLLQGQCSAMAMTLAALIGTLHPAQAARAAEGLKMTLAAVQADDLADPETSDRLISSREGAGNAFLEALEQRSRAE